MRYYCVVIFLLFLIFFNSHCFAEERFVGEFAGAGVYAEVDDITLTEEYLVTRIFIKKPLYNRLVEENIRFNRKMNTYEIIRRKIYNYSPRELLEEQKGTGVALPIPFNSIYGAVLNFVVAWQTRTEPDI